MKKVLYIVILVGVVVGFCAYVLTQTSGTATKADVENVRAELKRQIDSVLRATALIKADTDTLKSELRQVSANTDTLKAGQAVIFQNMQENKDKSFWDLFK